MQSALEVLTGINDSACWPVAQENVKFLGESDIGQGTCLRCINTPASDKLPVFESPYSVSGQWCGMKLLKPSVELFV